MQLSVIIPVFNEEENIAATVSAVAATLEGKCDFELLAVDDGSTDRTLEILNKLADGEPLLKVISYSPNRGRGRALRAGFEKAAGDLVVTIDADLSYSPDHILKIVEAFRADASADIVVGSPYMRGGRVENVPVRRLIWSRWGNKFLSFIMPGRLTTFTGILRGYRREVIKALQLESVDKEIHLEILSKAVALNYQIIEIPATLSSRQKGRSKFKLRATVFSHILFSLFEKPSLFMGVIGAGMIFLGLLGGGYIVYLWQKAALNPERPLMTLLVLLILSGIQIIAFSVIATQLIYLRNEVYRIQRDNQEIKSRLKS